MRANRLITDYLLVWILLSVALGLIFPQLSRLSSLSTLILAVMIGSISLTLSPESFRSVRPASLGTILAVQTVMPFLAYAVARALSLSPELTLGFVVLGAVTPELVTPVMTKLAGGDTALATTALIFVGFGSVALIPLSVLLLLGQSVEYDPLLVVRQLLLAVALPMAAAVTLRAKYPERIEVYDEYLPSVSALMVIIIIGIVTAANTDALLNQAVLGLVAVGAAALNLMGYLLGWVSSGLLDSWFNRKQRITALYSVGMRDFAVAAAIVVSAGFPTIASVPAVTFGVIEMLTAAALSHHFMRT